MNGPWKDNLKTGRHNQQLENRAMRIGCNGGWTGPRKAATQWISAGVLAVAAAGLAGCGRVPEAGEVKTITLPGGAKMEMVWCPPGTFLMGSPENEAGRDDDETLHQVTLTKGFWMARTEVTQAQWESVMGNNPAEHRGENLPVEQVSWEDCIDFCRKAGLRLPTEAEWEYACRAGSTGKYAGTGDLDDMGWYDDNSRDYTHPVGQKTPNAWGLFDMHGNVSEWCEDWSTGDYSRENVTDPQGADFGMARGVRGGDFSDYRRRCRSASRWVERPGNNEITLGFRPVFSGKAKAKAGEAGATSPKTLRQKLGGIARTKGKGAKMKLYGMFGAQFGKVMPEAAVCTTNTTGERVYTYKPKKPLAGFGKYELHATPMARKVFAIRASGAQGSFTEMRGSFHETVGLLEKRFGEFSEVPSGIVKLFDNDSCVEITGDEAELVILATDLELQKLVEKELGELEDKMLAEDIRVLALEPARNGDAPLERIDSVFGVVFGEPCRWGKNPEENDAHAWVYTFEPEGAFMGCSEFRVFATSESKRVFAVRATFLGDSDDETQEKYDQMRRMFERLTGKEFKDGDADERGKSCGMTIGDNTKVHLEKICVHDECAVILDVANVDLYVANQQEAAEKEFRLLEEDIRVLALRPEREGAAALEKIDSVFGVVFGESCRWGRNPEENDSHAWVYTFEPEGSFMDFSRFRVFATAGSKRVFMVRAVFLGYSDDVAQGKYDQMRSMLERLAGKKFKDVESSGHDKSCRMLIGSHFCIDLEKHWSSDMVMLDFISLDMYALNGQEAAEANR